EEETAHFRAVHAQLVERDKPLSVPEQDGYVNALWSSTKPERGRVPVLLDRLLVNALIEARSCERFKLLSERLEEASLRTLYRELMESAARHSRMFRGLSEELFGVKLARARLGDLALRESQVASQLALGPKVHG